MRKTMKQKLIYSGIYAIIMSIFNIIKVKNNIGFIELLGDFCIYFVAILIAQFFTEILFDTKENK